MNKKSVKGRKDSNQASQTDIGRGTIKGSFLAALVTSKMYKQQIVKAKKGKGSYQRKEKYQGKNKSQDSYLIAA